MNIEISKQGQGKTMAKILIGSQNPYKQGKMSEIVSRSFVPYVAKEYPVFEETGRTFEEIAGNKALAYAKWAGCLAISTDGGAVIPSLSSKEWKPLETRRFGETDMDRLTKLLDLMRDKSDRTVQWIEAIAIASPERVLFSTTVRAMDGTIDRELNPEFYRDGIWLCSITSFPQFGGRNFFELTSEEQKLTEDSWAELGKKVMEFLDSASWQSLTE